MNKSIVVVVTPLTAIMEDQVCRIKIVLLNEHAAYKRRGPRAEVIIVMFKIDKIDKDG